VNHAGLVDTITQPCLLGFPNCRFYIEVTVPVFGLGSGARTEHFSEAANEPHLSEWKQRHRIPASRLLFFPPCSSPLDKVGAGFFGFLICRPGR